METATLLVRMISVESERKSNSKWLKQEGKYMAHIIRSTKKCEVTPAVTDLPIQ